jgi:hypothetical protein
VAQGHAHLVVDHQVGELRAVHKHDAFDRSGELTGLRRERGRGRRDVVDVGLVAGALEAKDRVGLGDAQPASIGTTTIARPLPCLRLGGSDPMPQRRPPTSTQACSPIAASSTATVPSRDRFDPR